MKKRRGTPRRRKPAKKTTAIAKRPPVEVLPAIGPRQALSATPQIGELGLAELKLSGDEERVLAEPVNPRDVQIKPTGQPYLSHPAYTRWFNRAFGRLGWALVPCSTASIVDNTVQCSYLFYIHGKPVAFAVGEQEYWKNNQEQTYGDALEATNASALRRLAKRMGVGLELWDKAWLEEWIAHHATEVKVEKRYKDDAGKWQTKEGWAWRRKDQAPLYNELDGKRRSVPTQSSSYNAKADEPITDAQRIRFWTIVKKRGRTQAEVGVWLACMYNVTDTHAIKRRDYEAICTAVEKPGPLPSPPEAGEEG